MENELKYINEILRSRFDDDKMLISVSVKEFSEKDDWFEVEIRYGVPATCAAVIYLATHHILETAWRLCIENLLNDKRLETELG